MMKFDYLQLRTEAKYIEIDKSKFDIISGGETNHELDIIQLSASTKNKIKSTLDIPMGRVKVDITGPYLSLGITSKLLCNNYQELISKETITDCLESLVRHGVLVDIDARAIEREAKITVAETTKDLIHSKLLTRKDYEFFSKAVFNPYRWNPKVWEYGFGLSKEVKAHKEYLSMYNKSQEMNLPRSKKYNDRYLQHNPFENDKSVRVEGRFFSAKSIKKHFGGNSVDNLLHHDDNILKNFIKKVLVDPEIFDDKTSNRVNQKNLNFAKNLDYDSRRIADVINSRHKHNRVRKYRDVMNSVIASSSTANEGLMNLQELLKKLE